MSENLRYITDEAGKKVGVLLDWESYRQIENPLLRDGKCLVGLTREELGALANCKLSPAEQGHLDVLLQKQAETTLSEAEIAEMDRILLEADRLMVLKARALYTLKRLDELATGT